jgi:hydrogenase large subunit
MSRPEATFEWKIPVDKQGQPLSNAIERNRARTYFQAYSAGVALYFVEQALAEIRAGRTKTWESFNVPQDANSCGFTEAVRGVLSHHMVIRDGKIANYHPYPPTPWNGSVRDSYGTPGPYEDAVQNTPIFEENPPDNFKGIDIMRAVRSFDPKVSVRPASQRAAALPGLRSDEGATREGRASKAARRRAGQRKGSQWPQARMRRRLASGSRRCSPS